MARPFRRHDLVWLDQNTDASLFVLDPYLGQKARDWIADGHPFVVARQPEREACEGRLSLGFTLPPPLTRRRVALSVPREAVVCHTEPLGLAQARAHAPLWESVLDRLEKICSDAGVTPFVYGSLSWQAFTGHSYLTEKSDLDLLFVCDEKSRMLLLLAALEAFTEKTPRLDGEIVTPAGWAVAWRELASARHLSETKEVLAKSDRQVRLFAAGEFPGLSKGYLEAPCIR